MLRLLADASEREDAVFCVVSNEPVKSRGFVIGIRQTWMVSIASIETGNELLETLL